MNRTVVVLVFLASAACDRLNFVTGGVTDAEAFAAMRNEDICAEDTRAGNDHGASCLAAKGMIEHVSEDQARRYRLIHPIYAEDKAQGATPLVSATALDTSGSKPSSHADAPEADPFAAYLKPKADSKPISHTADAPGNVTVGEVSKDGHPAHNRLIFDCKSAAEPKTIECVVVQQFLTDPPPLTKERRADREKQLAALGDVLKGCEAEPEQWPGSDEPRPIIENQAKLASACKAKDRAAMVNALREMSDIDSQTCSLAITFPENWSFLQVNKDTWTRAPDEFRECANIEVTGTLRRDPKYREQWNYTEVVVATPSTRYKTTCRGVSGTTKFTWRATLKPSDLGCRYINM